MSNLNPGTGGWSQDCSNVQQQQYPLHEQQYAPQQPYPAPEGYPAATYTAHYGSEELAAPLGPISACLQPMQAPSAGQCQPYAAAASGSSSSNFNSPYAQNQQQYPQNQHSGYDHWGQSTQQQQGPLQEDAAASSADGSRGLGSSLMGAGHQMHNVGLTMHHVAHPVQGLKFHTVDKVKRKLKGKVCHLVDKIIP